MDQLIQDALSTYENAQNNTSSSSNNDKNRYLVTALKDSAPVGEEMTKTVRIIPMEINGKQVLYGTAYFHSVQIDGKWRKIYDPDKNDGEESPLTDAARAIFDAAKEQTNEEIKKSLKSEGAKLLPDMYYIFKVLERGAELEGPKYWRFKNNHKGEGVMDKIIPIMKGLLDAGKPNIHDSKDGRDLTITFKKVSSNFGKPYTKVTSIQKEDPSVITSDPAVINLIKQDTTNWKDVYKKYPKEFLVLVAEGETPVWDKDLKKYVAKKENDVTKPSDIEIRETTNEAAGTSRPEIVAQAPTQVQDEVKHETTTTSDANIVGISDEDLPF